MRRYSPPYYSPPRRGYGGRGRSPPPRGYGGRGRSPPPRGYGGYGGRKEHQNHGSLLVRNVPLSSRPEDLRVPFERFGPVRDVYLPKDYYTGEPRGFAFVQYVDPFDAKEAQYHMNGQLFCGRELTVVVAAETRKRPEDMRNRSRTSGSVGNRGGRSSYYGRSRSRSPHYSPHSRSRYRSRSYSPRSPQYSISPRRRHADSSRSPRDLPPERDERVQRRSYSPGYGDADRDQGGKGYHEKPIYGAEETQAGWRSPGSASRSPSGSRSRSADLSPRRSR